MLLLLSSHRLLNDIVDLVAVRFVENWRVVPRGRVVDVLRVRVHVMVVSTAVLMVVMVCGGAVQRAFGIRHLDGIRVVAHHFPVVRAQSVLVLVMVLVELDHGELLLERTCPLLLNRDTMLHVLMISTLILAGSLYHVSIICTVLLDVGLVT